jgi:hypothetical protein
MIFVELLKALPIFVTGIVAFIWWVKPTISLAVHGQSISIIRVGRLASANLPA